MALLTIPRGDYVLLSETYEDWLNYVTRSTLGDKAVHGNLSAVFWRIVGEMAFYSFAFLYNDIN